MKANATGTVDLISLAELLRQDKIYTYALIRLQVFACPATGNRLIMARLQQLGPAGSRHLRESGGDFLKLSGHLICINPQSRGRNHRPHRWRNGMYNRKKIAQKRILGPSLWPTAGLLKSPALRDQGNIYRNYP